MKKIFLFLFAATTLLMTGCLETIEEITLNEDGSGTYTNINDESKIVPAARNMGLSNSQIGGPVDSTFALGSTPESVEGLSAEDAALLKKGTMKIKMNMDDEVLITTMKIPFSSLNELSRIKAITAKSLTQSAESMMKSMMGGGGGGAVPGMGGQMPEPSSIGDYYTLEYESGEIKRKLNKEKYANLSSDKMLAQMQEGAAMGVPVTYTFIVNLPKPAKEVEGKNAKLSDDKKKLTVKGTIDDFFDSPEKLEFKVKY